MVQRQKFRPITGETMKLIYGVTLSIFIFLIGTVTGLTLSRHSQPVITTLQIPEEIKNIEDVVKSPSMPERQRSILNMAYIIAKKDGHEYPELLQGILLQETGAGLIKRYKVVGQEYGLKPTQRYYGLAQIKLSATWDVLRRFPKMKQEFKFNTMTDDEIIAKLIENDKFNIAVASKYLLILRERGYTDIRELAMAYNVGPGKGHHIDANTNPYAAAVVAKIDSMKGTI